MLESPRLELRVVGPNELSEERRLCLRPGEEVVDRFGVTRRLPSYFYEVPSWSAALDIKLAPDFGLWELIEADVREAEPMRIFPRYVPCALAVLAGQLQLFRSEIGRVVRIAANGAYRSPSHALADGFPSHCWGSAANVYRIGDEWLDSAATIEKYAEIARRVLGTSWTRPYGDRPGQAFDHLHIDLGYLSLEPHLDEARASGSGAKEQEG